MSWLADHVDDKVVKYLFNVKVNLPESVGHFCRDSSIDLYVDFDKLESQLAEIPEIIALYDILLSEQRTNVDVLSLNLTVLKATVAETALKDAKTAGVDLRRMDVKDIIDSDPNVIEVATRILIEKRKEDKLKAVVLGLQKKADSLRSLAGFKREEKRIVNP